MKNKKRITNQEIFEAILLLQQEMHHSFRELRTADVGLDEQLQGFRGEMYAFRGEMHAFRAKTEAMLALHSGALNRIERRLDNHSERIRIAEERLAL